VVSRETAGEPPGAIPDLPAWLAPARPGLVAFADVLAGDGVTRGLIGPREVPRLWDRHLLNCAVVADPGLGLVGSGAHVVDVGSGAGLPGLVWAITRPDLRITLVEPLLRRSTFLTEVVDRLDLAERVVVWRGRAEDAVTAVPAADVVTARAVAPLDRLLGWTIPLLREGGRLVALKGSSARQEVADASAAIAAQHLVEVDVLEVGAGIVDPPTTVVTCIRGAVAGTAQ
jgi:16S rRNA (guanine527-N7)-methyltransferase